MAEQTESTGNLMKDAVIEATKDAMAQQEEQKEEQANGSKKLLFITGDYVEDYEMMVPFQVLSAAGYEIDTVCPDKTKGDKVKTSIHDFEGAQTYSEKVGHNFELNADFKECAANLKVYAGLIIPGGRAPEYLSTRDDIIKLVTYFTDNNLPIAAICHGPLILGAIKGFLKGKKATCYPACKPVLDIEQADYQAADPITTCFTDGNLVTGAAWPAHPQFCSQFMDLLGAKVTKSADCKGKILIIAGDYVEDYEMMTPFQGLTCFGFDVKVVCPGKKSGDKIKTCIHDFEGDQTYTEKPGHLFELNLDFDAVKVSDYDALYIPGGRCSEYLSVDDKVISIVQEFAKEKKLIAQICHGVLVLAAAKILEGRKTSCYPACKPFVDISGGIYTPSEPVTQCFTDKKDKEYTLISGAAWPGHPEFMAQIIKELGVKVEI